MDLKLSVSGIRILIEGYPFDTVPDRLLPFVNTGEGIPEHIPVAEAGAVPRVRNLPAEADADIRKRNLCAEAGADPRVRNLFAEADTDPCGRNLPAESGAVTRGRNLPAESGIVTRGLISPDLVYKVRSGSCEFIKEGTCIYSDRRNSIYRSGDRYTRMWTALSNESAGVCAVSFDIKRKYAEIYIPDSFPGGLNGGLIFLSLMNIELALLSFKRIIMHAAVSVCDGCAVLFTGPSGIGKSTQADQWLRLRGADILNGDRAILSSEGETLRAWGSPFAGSSGIYKNASAPVRAVVMLGKGKENSLERLTGKRAYKCMIPRFSLLRWDERLMNESLSMVERLIDTVPVYMLKCRLGEEAVDLLYDELFM